MGVSPRWAKLSRFWRSSLVNSQSLNQKKKLELKITQSQRSWNPRFSGAVRPGLSVVLGCGNWSPGVCRQEQKWKKKQGDGEKLNVLSQTSELCSVLGRILVWAVLRVDFIQAGSHTSR